MNLLVLIITISVKAGASKQAPGQSGLVIMSFSDDEAPAAGPKKAVHPGDRVRLVAHCNDKAPLEANWQQVLVEIVDTSSASERSGLDLVAVLDISGSMEGDKLNKLKRAMNFVIGKLGPMDRLSIVSFSTEAEKLCPLRVMSEAAKEELKDDIVEKRLTAGGYTNMRDGLLTGLRVLAERRHRGGGRVSSIVFMSDGVEYPKPPPDGGATGVDVGHVAVYTFGFGEVHDAKVLESIASKSQGGTFHFVSDDKSFTVRFAEILGGLLSVVVQDLNLTVWQQPGHSTIEAKEVYAGSYPKVGDSAAGSVTVSFGDLFSGEARKVLVRVLLHAVHNEHRVAVLLAQCSYRVQGETFYCPRDHQMRCYMRRDRSASPGAMNAEVEQELERIRYVDKIDEAIATGNYARAHRELGEHQKVLEAKPPNRMIRRLWEELQHLLSLKTWAALFATLLSYKVSHDRQRGGHFATQRMRRYAGQADEFEKDPSKPPPPEADDVKQEREEEQAATRKKPPVAEARTWVVWDGPRERRSSGWWAWATVILCTVLAIAVIVAGAAVFAVYMLFKPKMPYLAVSDARLGLLQYDQGGTIQSLQMSITIRAENNNSKTDATFSRVDLALGFNGVDVALLRAEPFVVARESSLPLQYNVVSAGRTLDSEGMQAMDAALKAGVVPFDLLGKARTRWKVGVFVRLRYWTRISCRLRLFFPGNGTVVPTDRDRCRSR